MDDGVNGFLAMLELARIRRDVDALAAFHTRHVASGEANIGAAAAHLASRFEDAGRGRLKVYLDTFEVEVARLGGRILRMSNVVAELPGEASPERVLVVGGHYDSRATGVTDAASRAPGANDDASGVALTLELARVLSSRRWPCTIAFIAFTGEEMGLLGARNWATSAKAAGRTIAAMLNNDMVGNTTDFAGRRCDDRVRVFSEGLQSAGDATFLRRLGLESDSPSRQLARYAFETGARYLPGLGVDLVMRPDRLGRGGDHLPFSDQGFPAIRFVEALENYDRQHQDVRTERSREYGDLPRHVDDRYVCRIGTLNCAVLASLALAPPAPSSVIIERPVSHSPRITWEAQEDTIYAVRKRRTTSAHWDERVNVKDGDYFEVTPAEVSDCVFAVEAIGSHGHASIAVVATPAAAGRSA